MDNAVISLCTMTSATDKRGEPYVRFPRVADVRENDKSGVLTPYRPNKTETGTDWKWIFNRESIQIKSSSSDDFVYLKWEQDPYDSNSVISEVATTKDDGTPLEHPILAIRADGGVLNDSLCSGIPCLLRPTKTVLVFNEGAEGSGRAEGLLIQKTDLDPEALKHDMLRIKSYWGAHRIQASQAELVHFDRERAISIYKKPEHYAILPSAITDTGTFVMVGDMQAYACDLIATALQNKDTSYAQIAEVVQIAFERENPFIEKLHEGLSDIEIKELRTSLSLIAQDFGPNELKDVAEALYSCPSIKKELTQAAKTNMQSSNEWLRLECERLETQLAAAESAKEKVEEESRAASAELINTQRALSAKQKELSSFEQDFTNQVSALKEDAVAQLFFDSARPFSDASNQTQMRTAQCIQATHTCKDAAEALCKNMKSNGISHCKTRSINLKPEKQCASSILGGLIAFRAIAVPSAISNQIAKSLATLLGLTSFTSLHCSQTGLPNLNEVAKHDLLLVENAIDSVNEPAINSILSLLNEHHGMLLIFSYTSIASLKLLAREFWGRIFYPSTSMLWAHTDAPQTEALHAYAGKYQDIIESTTSKQKSTDGVFELMPPSQYSGYLRQSAQHALSAMPIAKPEDSETAYQLIAQHVYVASGFNSQTKTVASEYDEDGIEQLAVAIEAVHA